MTVTPTPAAMPAMPTLHNEPCYDCKATASYSKARIDGPYSYANLRKGQTYYEYRALLVCVNGHTSRRCVARWYTDESTLRKYGQGKRPVVGGPKPKTTHVGVAERAYCGADDCRAWDVHNEGFCRRHMREFGLA